jgi:protein-glucosylgalactosylhydroxylysine glucosidase
MSEKIFLILLFPLFVACSNTNTDRKAIVSRHNIDIDAIDTLNSLTLGNGAFAMTMDFTGLQTFPGFYRHGIPLGTEAEWGWHSFPANRDYSIDETVKPLFSHGRQVAYAVQWPAGTTQGEAADYIRKNPHRIHLASIGLYITRSDGSDVSLSDFKDINQHLNMWNGELISRFTIEDTPVEIVSLIGQGDNNILGVRIKSPLLKEGRLGLRVRYPFPTGEFLDEASLFATDEGKRISLTRIDSHHISILRTIDTTRYYTTLSSSAVIDKTDSIQGGLLIRPGKSGKSWTFFISFSPKEMPPVAERFGSFRKNVHAAYHSFWNKGGIIDFGGVSDHRAAELERRMVLSLYLTKVNCGGSSFPQETGLIYNSWYGRQHMEMAWWHGVHFAQWGHPEILERQMQWYFRSEGTARTIAERQGFRGVRWQKMTDNNGSETPSSVGSFLIWQQPHAIYFAELLYRIKKDKETINRYSEIVDQTAEFMAAFAYYDPLLKRYILPGVIPAQEQYDPAITFNPTFELAYWRWALETAQQWRIREGLNRKSSWDNVLKDLSPLPHGKGLYLAAESAPDSYTNPLFMEDHPSVLGAYGMLPATPGCDTPVMHQTLEYIRQHWQWNKTWGWDFPMAAMTAARLGLPDEAVDLLLIPAETNTFLINGHNYQNKRLRIYLPGNGGFLTALGLMAAGTDEKSGSCFPKGWNVRYEGLYRLP